jgi:MFS transporter, MHS family, shikimate and dehydroshikimate transport protein
VYWEIAKGSLASSAFRVRPIRAVLSYPISVQLCGQIVRRGTALTGVMIAAAFGVVLVPIYGLLSDRFGRRVVYSVGTVLFGLFAFPSFLLVNTRESVLIWLSIVVALGLIYPPIYAPLAAFWSELFDTRVR